MTPLIHAKDLSITYENSDTPMIAHTDFDIEQNEIFVLVGPSGCGKSTILRAVAGFLPASGTLEMAGAPIVDADWQRGVVFQNSSLYPWLTVADNIGFGLKARHLPAKPQVDKLLSQIGLVEQAKHYPYELSGGMRQRVAIARVLANQPPLMLMDEPFGALDAFTRQQMQGLVLDLWRQNQGSIFLITHDLNEAIRLGSRIAVMTAASKKIVRTFDNPYQGWDSETLTDPEQIQHFDTLRQSLLAAINQA